MRGTLERNAADGLDKDVASGAVCADTEDERREFLWSDSFVGVHTREAVGSLGPVVVVRISTLFANFRTLACNAGSRARQFATLATLLSRRTLSDLDFLAGEPVVVLR